FEEVTGTISTYAHWLKMSRQVMTDNAALVGFTQQRASYGLELKIEDALLNGDGTSGKMSGLLDTGNFTAFTPTALDTAVDSLRKAKLALEAANYQCGLFILNPTDVSAIELLKDTDEAYLVGKPIEGGLTSLWGVPVYATTAITAGTFVALDAAQAVSLHLREDTVIEFSDSDDDNFTKNLVTMRVEARLGFGVHLPLGVRAGDLTV
ncbi:MAG: phage major capsid protein, partial [Aestuariibacter sp.]|nr:phage major capsid protein [Aestuariibacter sp.]